MFSQLKQGDVVNRNGECFKILGVCGEVVFFEEDTMVVSRSKRELETQGYRLLEDKKPWVPREEKDEIFHLYFSPATVGVGIATTFLRKGDTEWNAKFLESNNYFRTAAEAILASDKVKELLKSIKEG